MQTEKPAEGIMKTHDFGDSIYYRVDCACGNEDDQIDFEVELDKEMKQVILNLWTVQKTDWWTKPFKEYSSSENAFVEWVEEGWFRFWNGLFIRLKHTWTLWWYGYVKYYSTTIMSQQQALNFAETIKTAISHVETEAPYRDRNVQLVKEVKKLKAEIEKLRWQAQEQD